jgi:pilus assembly protein CpaE
MTDLKVFLGRSETSGSGGAAGAAKKRAPFIGFVSDHASAGLLHQAFEPAFPKGNEFHVVPFRTALTLLGAMTTPEIVLVDLSGETQPINAMLDLAEVVEPGTLVLAIGESRDVGFYRAVTKGMGVREYLPKPLSKVKLEQHFLICIKPGLETAAVPRGGRLISIAGARGGIGTSTIAANLAWVIGTEMRRHTILLDSDLYTGTAALTLNVKATSGLRTALEAPERVDQLLIERSAQPAGERLHVLAAAEQLDGTAEYVEGGAAMLCQALRQRYNFVIADAAARQLPFARDLQFLAQRRLIVVDPTMVAVRNFGKILEAAHGSVQISKPVVVLNYAGRAGGLSEAKMEEMLGVRFSAVIPDLPRVLSKAAHFGEPAASMKGPFRDAVFRIAKAIGANLSGETLGGSLGKIPAAA